MYSESDEIGLADDPETARLQQKGQPYKVVVPEKMHE